MSMAKDPPWGYFSQGKSAGSRLYGSGKERGGGYTLIGKVSGLAGEIPPEIGGKRRLKNREWLGGASKRDPRGSNHGGVDHHREGP